MFAGFGDLHTVGILGKVSIQQRLTGLTELGIELTAEEILGLPPKERPEALKRARRNGQIIVDPPHSEEEMARLLGATSIDLEMGSKIRIHSNPYIHPVSRGGILEPPVVDLTIPETIAQIGATDRLYELNNEGYVLPPHALVKTHTLRYYFMPYDLLGWVTGRSSVGRWGVTTTVDAPGIDPGFSGRIVLELAHLGDWGFVLRKGLLIAQMRFLTVEGKIGTPYDEKHDVLGRQDDIRYMVAPRSSLPSRPVVIRRGISPFEEES